MVTVCCGHSLILLPVILSTIGPEDQAEEQVPGNRSKVHASDTSSGERARVWINGMVALVRGLIRRLSLHYASSTCLGVTLYLVPLHGKARESN
jgi:hypothetical protein